MRPAEQAGRRSVAPKTRTATRWKSRLSVLGLDRFDVFADRVVQRFRLRAKSMRSGFDPPAAT
jgi:hypothetical protein